MQHFHCRRIFSVIYGMFIVDVLHTFSASSNCNVSRILLSSETGTPKISIAVSFSPSSAQSYASWTCDKSAGASYRQVTGLKLFKMHTNRLYLCIS